MIKSADDDEFKENSDENDLSKKTESWDNKNNDTMMTFSKVQFRTLIVLSSIFLLIAGLFVFFEFLKLRTIEKRTEIENSKLEDTKKRTSLEIGEFWDNQLNNEVRQIYRGFQNWYEKSGDNKNQKEAWLRLICKGQKNPQENIPPNNNYPVGVREMAEQLGYLDSKKGDLIISVSELEKIRSGLVRMLNVMEHIAVAHEYNVANRKMLEDFFYFSINDYYSVLKPFVKEYIVDEPHSWEPLTKKVESNWK